MQKILKHRDFFPTPALMISPQQCRAARAWFKLSEQDLAWSANVSVETVRRFEGRQLSRLAPGVAAMQSALERRGVQFFDGDALVVSEQGRRRRIKLNKYSTARRAKASVNKSNT